MLDMRLYIRHKACHMPLISLRVFRAHTCATGGCFLFGPGSPLLREKARSFSGREKGGRKGDRTTTDEQMRQSYLFQTTATYFICLIPFLCCTLSRGQHTKCIPPPCGHFRKHSSGSLLLQRMLHCERSSVLNRHPPISAKGQFLL